MVTQISYVNYDYIIIAATLHLQLLTSGAQIELLPVVLLRNTVTTMTRYPAQSWLSVFQFMYNSYFYLTDESGLVCNAPKIAIGHHPISNLQIERFIVLALTLPVQHALTEGLPHCAILVQNPVLHW